VSADATPTAYGGGDSARNADLAKGVCDVVLRGLSGDAERRPNLDVRPSVRNEQQNLDLAVR
jgi:hypothetical protein